MYTYIYIHLLRYTQNCPVLLKMKSVTHIHTHTQTHSHSHIHTQTCTLPPRAFESQRFVRQKKRKYLRKETYIHVPQRKLCRSFIWASVNAIGISKVT